jgi:deazaflavin-dependent oxidoreductase (nitroreductase family)
MLVILSTPAQSDTVSGMNTEGLADEQYCYLTTTGRVSGEPREIEIWFVLVGTTVLLLSGSGRKDGRPAAHWVRNLSKTPEVTVRIAGCSFQGRARLVSANSTEDALARELLVKKYQPSYSGSLDGWGKTSLPVAIDLKV